MFGCLSMINNYLFSIFNPTQRFSFHIRITPYRSERAEVRQVRGADHRARPGGRGRRITHLLRDYSVSVTVMWSTIFSFLLVLGCIAAEFCVQGRVLKHFSNSTCFPLHHSRFLRFLNAFAPFRDAENFQNPPKNSTKLP